MRTFTILTTSASADMAALHDRMPVILDPAEWPLWLGEVAGDYAALMRPAGVGTVRPWPVSRAVNNVRNNGPEMLIQAADVAPLTAVEAAVYVKPA